MIPQTLDCFTVFALLFNVFQTVALKHLTVSKNLVTKLNDFLKNNMLKLNLGKFD